MLQHYTTQILPQRSSIPFFVFSQKKAFAQGRGGGVPIASTNMEVKGKIDGRKFT